MLRIFSLILVLIWAAPGTAALPQPVGHWALDLCSGDAVIVDQIQGANGTAYNSTANINGKYCQSSEFSGAKSYIKIPSTPQLELSEGTIAFWFKVPDLGFTSTNPGYGGQALISRDADGQAQGGHLTIWVDASGQIHVRHQEQNGNSYTLTRGTVTANTWHHVVYTFGPPSGAAGTGHMRLYIDGARVGLNNSFNGGIDGNQEPFILGANAWTAPAGGGAPVSYLRDFLQGQIDDLRIYNVQLTRAEVTELYGLSGYSCPTCDTTPDLISHWALDTCSVNGSANEIFDKVGGYHGFTKAGAGINFDGKFCQASSFAGNGGHINIPHRDAFIVPEGSLAFWFKAPDLNFNAQHHHGGMALFSKDSQGFDTGGHLTIWMTSGGGIRVRHQNTSASYELTSTHTNASYKVTANTWNHVVYSFGSGGMKLYVNGQLWASNSTFKGGLQGNNEPIVLGVGATVTENLGSNNNLKDYFKGELDDVRLYSGQLDTDTITALYTANGESCTNCAGGQEAWYRFEEDNWSANGDILDASGKGNHGNPLGGVTPKIPANQVSCGVLSVPFNTGVNEKVGLDTNVDLNALGNRGTISFWYRSNERWMASTPRQLLDASNTIPAVDKFFFLSLEGGKLRFGLEDSADIEAVIESPVQNFGNSTWVHIAVSWDTFNDAMAIYINGVAVASTTSAGLNGTLGDMATLYVGDNRTSYLVSGASANSANGDIDEVRLYSLLQTEAQITADMNNVTPCDTLSHYQLEHDGQGLTCEAETMVLKACANADCSLLVPDPTTFTLGIKDSNGALLDTAAVTFIGSTSIQLSVNVAATLTLTKQLASPDASLKCLKGTEESCQMEFVEASIELVGSDGVSPYSQYQVAETDFENLAIRAVYDGGTGQCLALLSNKTQPVRLAYQCVSPNVCKTTMTVNGIPMSQSSADGYTFEDVNLYFDANGVAQLAGSQGVLNYADAGQLDFGIDAAIYNPLLGTESHFAHSNQDLYVLPQRLHIQATGLDTPPIAGKDFSLTLEALGSKGRVLPNYEAGALQLSVLRLLPIEVTGHEGTLTYANGGQLTSALATQWSNGNGVAFSDGGYAYPNAYYSEAGRIALDIRDNNYFGKIIDADALELGNFVPSHFDVQVNHPQLANENDGTFTYVGQPFGFDPTQAPEITLMAMSARSTPVLNYDNALWNWTAPLSELSNISVSDDNYAAGIALYGSAGQTINNESQADGGPLYDGRVGLEINDLMFRHSKTALPVTPFAASLYVTVPAAYLTDNSNPGYSICYRPDYPAGACAPVVLENITGANMRYGRLLLADTYGPETAAADMPLQAQYYNADGRYVLNGRDSSLSYVMTQSGGQLSASADPDSDAADISGIISGMAANGRLVNGQSMITEGVVIPATNVQGSAIIKLHPFNDPGTLTWDDYLNVDWNGDGVITSADTPFATLSLGLKRGNDRIIFWRENL